MEEFSVHSKNAIQIAGRQAEEEASSPLISEYSERCIQRIEQWNMGIFVCVGMEWTTLGCHNGC